MAIGIDLSGRSCLVVGGAGGGIGAEVVRLAGEAGAAVGVITHNASHADGIVAELTARGSRCESAVADVTDEAALVDAISQLQGGLGPFRHLVNVVGGAMGAYHRATDIQLSVVDGVVAQNFRYVVVACREIARGLIDARTSGSIVNISSGASRGRPMLGAYGAAKAALESYSRAIALEWAPIGIRVNVVSSGAVRTARTSAMGTPEAELSIPLRRRGEASEVAMASLFLLSDLAAYTTGQTLEVDGGVGLGHPGGEQLSAFIRPRSDGEPSQR